MSFEPTTESNPLPVVVVTAPGAFDPFAPITATNPLPVVAADDTADFIPYDPVSDDNPLPLDIGVASGTFDKFGAITTSNRLPIAVTSDTGSFAKFSPVTDSNALPVFSPYLLPNLAARYSLDGGESDSTYLTNGLGRVRLIADRSGNSAENCLVLNGSGGQYASSPKLVPTGTWRIEAKLAPTDWTSAASPSVAAVYNGAGDNRCWFFGINSSGAPFFFFSSDGTSGTTQTVTASAAVSFTDLSVGYIAATVNLAAGTVDFEQSSDGNTWSALGTQRTFTPLVLYAATTAVLEIGSNAAGSATNFAGLVYAVRIYQTGVLTKNFNPSGSAKLAATFVAPTTGETWTINTSGDLGARICGARDLYQATTTKMALLSTGADGRTLATFDGANDYMKAAPFSLSQPETVYFVGSQVTWTNTDYIFDGGGVDTMGLIQSAAGESPRVKPYAGGYGGNMDAWSLLTMAVIMVLYNGALSTIAINRLGAIAGPSTGGATSNGFTLATLGAASSAFGNITFNEAVIFAVAHADATRLRVAGALMRKWVIAA
jgi:hypothetical protein